MTPNEIIGTAANNVSDGNFVICAVEEYLAWVNDVAFDLWSESNAMHAIRQYAVTEGEYMFTFPDMDIIQFAELQLREGTPAGEDDDEPPVYDSTQNPVHVEEKPVHQNIREGLGNFRNLGQRVTHHYITIEFRNGQYVALSPQAFGANQFLHAHCIIHSEQYQLLDLFSDVELTSVNSIWEPFRNLFIEGVTWRAARRTANYSKDPTRRQIWNDSQNLYYNKYLPEAILFVNKLKNASSVMFMRTSRFLEE